MTDTEFDNWCEANGLTKSETVTPAVEDKKKRTRRPKIEEEGNRAKRSKLAIKPVDYKLIPEYFGKVKEEDKTLNDTKPPVEKKGKSGKSKNMIWACSEAEDQRLI